VRGYELAEVFVGTDNCHFMTALLCHSRICRNEIIRLRRGGREKEGGERRGGRKRDLVTVLLDRCNAEGIARLLNQLKLMK